MAKVKLPLEMANGVMVRTIEELKDNFDITKIVGHFLDGKLKNWLEVRYYEDELEKVNKLSESVPDLAKKLCDIFEVEYTDESIDIDIIQESNERLLKLKQYTDDEEIIANIDSVAFNQEELADLYDRGVEKIYLCEGEFKISKEKLKLSYTELFGATVEREITKNNLVIPEDLSDIINCNDDLFLLDSYLVWRTYEDDRTSQKYLNFFKAKEKIDDMTGDYYAWNFIKDEYSSFSLPHFLTSMDYSFCDKMIRIGHNYHNGKDYEIISFDIVTKTLKTIFQTNDRLDYFGCGIYDNKFYTTRCNQDISINLETEEVEEVSNIFDNSDMLNDTHISISSERAYSGKKNILFTNILTGNKEKKSLEGCNDIFTSFKYGDVYFIFTHNSVLGVNSKKEITKYCDIKPGFTYGIYNSCNSKYQVFYDWSNSFISRLGIFDMDNKRLKIFNCGTSIYDAKSFNIIGNFLYIKADINKKILKIDLSKKFDIKILK